MTDTQRNKRPARRPDCVTEIRMGNTVLVVSGFFKKDTTSTAAPAIRPELSAAARSCSTMQPPLAVFITNAVFFISSIVSLFTMPFVSGNSGQCMLITSACAKSSSRLTHLIQPPSGNSFSVLLLTRTFMPNA